MLHGRIGNSLGSLSRHSRGGVGAGGILFPAPILTQTTAAGTNPPEWDSDINGYALWDPATNTGDKQLLQWRRVAAGAWTSEAEQPLDDEVLTGGFTWPLLEAAKPLAGGYFEAQEQRVRYAAGVEVARSPFSNSVIDNLAAPPFSPASLFGAGDLGYAFDTTDGSKVWQNVAGTTPGAFASVVGKLTDISGKGNNLAASGDNSTRPIWANVNNGLIQFDGSNDELDGIGGFYAKGAMTFIAVVKGANQANFIWAETSGASANPVYAPGLRGSGASGFVLNYQRNDANTAIANSIATALLDGAAHMLVVQDTGASVKVSIDGAAFVASAYTRSGAFTTTRTTLGVANNAGGLFGPFNGSIGSPFAIGRLLTGAAPSTAGSELRSIYNYIAAKHGLATL